MGGGGYQGSEDSNGYSPSPPTAVPDSDLEDTFQGAMYALRSEREQATVVDTDGNEALIWLGQYHLHEYSERWDKATAELYVLVDQNFAGSDPHWVMMAPAVTVDGNGIGVIECRHTYLKDSRNHSDKVQKVLDVSGADDAVAFSWRWSKMNRQPSSARDLQKAHRLVEHLLQLDEPQESV